MIIVITKNIMFNPIITAIPNKLIKEMIQLFEKSFGNINAQHWKKI